MLLKFECLRAYYRPQTPQFWQARYHEMRIVKYPTPLLFLNHQGADYNSYKGFLVMGSFFLTLGFFSSLLSQTADELYYEFGSRVWLVS